LNDLITDVLDLSRMEQEVSLIQLELIDFNPIVEKIVEANRMMAEAKGLEIAFDADPSLPELYADSSQLEQVCTNLIANAINYTQKGGVTVSTTNLDGKGQCVFRVQDTGMGISEDELDHLFDRFYRGRQASQSSIPGTGLGLSITKEIIEAHNGSIDVESEVDVGTIFSVYLPIPKDGQET
jgi:signal transduction histidine kinase